MNKGRVGEERGGKEMDRCPHRIELKIAALIWRTAPEYLRWNCAIFGFVCTCVCTSH
jgi:hypothetical protein